MAKALNQLKETLKFIDVIVEIADARIPVSSRNPDFGNSFSHKPRLLLLNKRDLADETTTNQWLQYFLGFKGLKAIAINTISKQGFEYIVPALRELTYDKLALYKAKGYRNRPIRVIVVGIPNVGKSSFINKFVGKSIAKTGDRPGVTKAQQWIRIHPDIELLDTPGLLWPKFEDPEVGIKLAATGAIKEEIIPLEDVACWVVRWFMLNKPEALINRYRLADLAVEPEEVLRQIGVKRGFLQTGGKVNEQKTAALLLDELQKGKIARVTFDPVPKG